MEHGQDIPSSISFSVLLIPITPLLWLSRTVARHQNSLSLLSLLRLVRVPVLLPALRAQAAVMTTTMITTKPMILATQNQNMSNPQVSY